MARSRNYKRNKIADTRSAIAVTVTAIAGEYKDRAFLPLWLLFYFQESIKKNLHRSFTVVLPCPRNTQFPVECLKDFPMEF